MPDLSLRAFAKRLHVNEKAIRLGIASGRLTRAVLGRSAAGRPVITDEARARREWKQNAGKQPAATPSRASMDLALERARGLRLANDLREGITVLAADVERRWAARVVQARTALLGLPTRLRARRPDLTREDLRVIDEEIRACLHELADRNQDPETESGAPPPKPDHEDRR